MLLWYSCVRINFSMHIMFNLVINLSGIPCLLTSENNDKSNKFCGCHTVKTWGWLHDKVLWRWNLFFDHMALWIAHVALTKSSILLLWGVVSSSNSSLLSNLFLKIDFKLFVLYFILKCHHLYLLSMIMKQVSALVSLWGEIFNMYSHLLNDFLSKFARSSPPLKDEWNNSELLLGQFYISFFV